MKAYYWLAAVLIFQIILPHTSGKEGEEDEDNPAKLVSNFVKVAVDQLKNDPDFAAKVKETLSDLREAFSSKEYEGTFIPVITKMLDEFLNNKYFISPETLLKLMKSVVNQQTREPDKLSNNLRRVGHRAVKFVGDTVKNVGSLGSAAVRVFEDLHSKQRQYTDPILAEIPYIGTVLQKINSAISKVIGAVHMIVKLGVKGLGTIINDFAEKRRLNLKRKTEEERKAANTAQEIDDENEEENDSDEKPEGGDKKAEKDDGNPPKEEGTPPKKKNREKPKSPVKKKTDEEKDKPTKT